VNFGAILLVDNIIKLLVHHPLILFIFSLQLYFIFLANKKPRPMLVTKTYKNKLKNLKKLNSYFSGHSWLHQIYRYNERIHHTEIHPLCKRYYCIENLHLCMLHNANYFLSFSKPKKVSFNFIRRKKFFCVNKKSHANNPVVNIRNEKRKKKFQSI
jgi:hypothetical protein